MFTIRNAMRNISRARGRSILIGIIITIIAFSVCIGLSIRQSSATAREIALSKLSITAQISPDREKIMESAKSSSGTNRPVISTGRRSRRLWRFSGR